MRLFIASALLSLALSRGEVIVQWDLNSESLEPSQGQGTLVSIGGVSEAFGSVASGATSDPAPAGNAQLRLGRFPAQGAASQTAGVQLLASTVGYRNLRLMWDHYNSASASRLWRIQFTTDGLFWRDHATLTNASAGSWQNQRTVSFSSIPDASDNELFGVRIVSEFASAEGYLPVSSSSSYSTAGTWYIDMLTLEGDPLHGPRPIALWNFNSLEPDDDPATGEVPSVTPVGGTSINLGSVASGATSDPASSDNSMLRVTGWPPRAENNKISGLEFRASTLGHTNLVLRWDQYNSPTASRHWRIQYSTNGLDFLDHRSLLNTVPSRWHHTNQVSFAGLPGVDHNPDFAFRLVSEFESTALGFGEDAYDAVGDTSNYSASGTLWLDMVTLLAEELPVASNSPPTLVVTTTELGGVGVPHRIRFMISDSEQPAEELVVSAVAEQIPPSALSFEGSGIERILTVLPPPGIGGLVAITLSVSDAQLTTSKEIVLFFNNPPSISLETSEIVAPFGVPVSFALWVEDPEQSPAELILAATSDTFPETAWLIQGAGLERIVTLNPPLNLGGEFTIIFSVSDGILAASAELSLRILPADPPRLSVSRSVQGLLLSWNQSGYILENTESLDSPDWQFVPDAPALSEGQHSLLVSPSEPRRFFRLRGNW